MQVTVEKKGDLSREMTVTVPATEVEVKVNERLEMLGKNVKIDGFRPGKVPMHVIKKRFGDKVGDEVSRDIVADTMPKAFDKEKLRPAGQPNVNFGDLQEGKDYSYKIQFDIMPEVAPKDYEGVKLTRYTAKVTDKLVQKALDQLLAARKSYAKKDGKIAEGDMAKINAKGFDEKGEALPGAEVTEFPLEIGSGQFIPGFEAALVGKGVGKHELDLTFPKEYHAKELAGKKAKFDVEVLEVQEGTVPELDDELAKSFGMESVDDLKTRLKEQLETDLKNASEQRMKRELFDHLDKNNSFSVPESMVDSEFQSIWRAMTQDMQRRGLTFDMMDQTEDEMRAEHRKLADRRVRLGLLLAEIGRKQDVEVDDKEVTEEIERMAQSYGDSGEQVRQYYQNPQAQQELVGPLFEKKVTEWIFEKAKIEDKEIDPDELLQEITG